MNRLRVLDFSDKEQAAMDAILEASILDEDAWEDATRESSPESELLRQPQWRLSALDASD